MKSLLKLAVVGYLVAQTSAFALNIRVIDAGYSHGMITNAKNYLTGLGHTVSSGTTLADYSAFDQVWDLRYNSALGAGDIAAMGAFLNSGRSIYLTGEHSGFAARNNSLVGFVSAVGGGTIALQNTSHAGAESITAAGQVVNNPNTFTSVQFSAANSVGVAGVGNGFQVTSLGSLAGWDFGDITGSPGARMLIGFDIEIFNSTNGAGWAQNMATYLGSQAPAAAPDAASSFGLILAGLIGLVSVRRFSAGRR